MEAVIREIWVATIPILHKNKNGDISVLLQKRPVLIFDDGRGLIVEEDKWNYHILKLTTQNDLYKRKVIPNWRDLGLFKKSYTRLEMPIKLEKEQLEKKLTELPREQLLEIYSEIYKLININSLKKMFIKYNQISLRKNI